MRVAAVLSASRPGSCGPWPLRQDGCDFAWSTKGGRDRRPDGAALSRGVGSKSYLPVLSNTIFVPWRRGGLPVSVRSSCNKRREAKAAGCVSTVAASGCALLSLTPRPALARTPSWVVKRGVCVRAGGRAGCGTVRSSVVVLTLGSRQHERDRRPELILAQGSGAMAPLAA